MRNQACSRVESFSERVKGSFREVRMEQGE